MSAALYPNGYTCATGWNFVGNKPAWANSSVEAYRIWMLWDGFIWWQRHEWKAADGSTVAEKWIRSCQTPPGPHYEMLAE